MSSSYDASFSVSNTNVNPNVEKKLKALIVNDNRTVTMIQKALVRKFGVEAHEVKNGEEAILAHRSGACFDMILIDLDLHVINVRQTIKELRDMQVYGLIVGVTFLGEEEMKPFMDAGLDYYYPMPLTIDAVHHLVEKIKENA
ncbi:hypothetical protein RND71_020344 [Anisodus tanguticus]|uniref:Response regulatory domain-containing protein n=1 Tax=Anisodus tanguticus TaxID=243964 RepID=A0AAE1S199_9SOLA|nr:hypothetical protein RND71_020344 [Anisodus tanguticus]